MKKHLLLIVMLLSVAASTFAVEVEIDGLWYDVNTETKEAKVIRYQSSAENKDDIVIPETVVYDGVTCSVTSIGEWVFAYSRGLTSVTIPNSVTSIGAYAFRECSGLTSITIPNSVTSIGGLAFENCSGLTSITIPNSITSIRYGVFYGCYGLTSVTIPNSVTSIGSLAFHYCYGLTSVIIPNSVTRIDQQAFEMCYGLTSVVIGSGVKSINSQAFANCQELRDVTCYAEYVPSTASDAFGDSNIRNATLHVPTASIDAYKMTEPWSGFKFIEGIETGIKDIKTNATSCPPIYDLHGHRVENTTKGLYIVNGNKVVIK